MTQDDKKPITLDSFFDMADKAVDTLIGVAGNMHHPDKVYDDHDPNIIEGEVLECCSCGKSRSQVAWLAKMKSGRYICDECCQSISKQKELSSGAV